MIECSLTEARKIHADQKLGDDVNYIFVQAPSVEDMTIRLLRNRPGQDTRESLDLKQNQMRADVELAKTLKFIGKRFASEGTPDDFLKKAAVYIIFQLYKMK